MSEKHRFVLAMFVIIHGLILPSYSQTAKTKVFTAIEDSFVMSDIPPPWVSQGYNQGKNQNFGDNSRLIAWNDHDYHSLIFIKFDLSSIPINSAIELAILELHTPELKPIDEIHVYVHFSSDNSWVESKICWNNKPSFDSNTLDSVVIVAPRKGETSIVGHWYSWDVTPACQSAFQSTNQRLTLVVDSAHVTNVQWYPPEFHSKEASYKPRLTVSYKEPQQPIMDGVGNGIHVQLIAIATILAVVILTIFVYLVRGRKRGSNTNRRKLYQNRKN